MNLMNLSPDRRLLTTEELSELATNGNCADMWNKLREAASHDPLVATVFDVASANNWTTTRILLYLAYVQIIARADALRTMTKIIEQSSRPLVLMPLNPAHVGETPQK